MGAGDALLVRDRNADGVINDGRELYGMATLNAHGQRSGDGYAAMRNEDDNHDGKITAADAAFSEMRLWVDANHDGKTDGGELHGLADFGIVELNLDHAITSTVNAGNYVGMTSSYTTADGQTREMADVWFSKQPDAAPTAADLLAGPATELLPGAAPAAAGSHAEPAAPTAHVAVPRNPLDDDLNRPVPLI